MATLLERSDINVHDTLNVRLIQIYAALGGMLTKSLSSLSSPQGLTESEARNAVLKFTNASGAFTIITDDAAHDAANDGYRAMPAARLVWNASGQAITVKASSGDTGVTVDNGYVRLVYFDGVSMKPGPQFDAATGAVAGGGGSFSASDITGQTEEAAPAAADYVVYYDASAGALRKMRRDNFLTDSGQSLVKIIATDAPYMASGCETTTTTTGTNSSGAATVNVTSSATFLIGHGIALSQGANLYVGEVTGVPGGTSIQVTPALTATFTAGATVLHDDSAAITAAVDAAAGAGEAGGEVFLPASTGPANCTGYYRCNGALDATDKGIVVLSQRGSTAAPITIRLVGEFTEHTSGQTPGYNGCIIDASLRSAVTHAHTDAAVITAKATSDTTVQANFNYIAVTAERIHVLLSPNSKIGGWNMHNAVEFVGEELYVTQGETPGTTMTQPTNTGSFGVIMPGINSHAKSWLNNVCVIGLYVGVRLNEHSKLHNVYVAYNRYGLLVEDGGHYILGNAGCEGNKTALRNDASLRTVVFDLTLSGELDHNSGAWTQSTVDLDDPNNTAAGEIRHEFTYPYGGTARPSITGFVSNCQLIDLRYNYRVGDLFVRGNNALNNGSMLGLMDPTAGNAARTNLQLVRIGSTLQTSLLQNVAATAAGGYAMLDTARKAYGAVFDEAADEMLFMRSPAAALAWSVLLRLSAAGKGTFLNGVNAAVAGTPSVQANGDFWVDTAAGAAKVRIGGVDVTLGAGGHTDEQIRDLIAAFIVAGSNVTVTHNDAGDTLTIAAGGGGAALPADYISGLKMVWDSATGVTVKSGSAYIEGSAAVLDATADITKSSLSLSALTWYHLYLYSNSGTPDVEVDTTAPAAPYRGTARSKSGNTSRRYVGSIRTDGSGNVINFIHHPHANEVRYRASVIAAPFTLVSAGTPTTETSVSASAVAPATSFQAQLYVNNTGSGSVLFGTSDDSASVPSSGLGVVAGGKLAVLTTPMNASQAFTYAFDASAGSGVYIFFLGYSYER